MLTNGRFRGSSKKRGFDSAPSPPRKFFYIRRLAFALRVCSLSVAQNPLTVASLFTAVFAIARFVLDATTRALEGYKLFQRKFYDLLISDVRMPFLTGTELAESLRQQCPATKIILISAFADEALKRMAN